MWKFDSNADSGRGKWSFLSKANLPENHFVRQEFMHFLEDEDSSSSGRSSNNIDKDIVTSLEEIKVMKVKALKKSLMDHDIDISNCIEKSDLIKLYMTAIVEPMVSKKTNESELAEKAPVPASSSGKVGKRLRVFGGGNENVRLEIRDSAIPPANTSTKEFSVDLETGEWRDVTSSSPSLASDTTEAGIILVPPVSEAAAYSGNRSINL